MYQNKQGRILVTRPVYGYADGLKQKAVIGRLNMQSGLFSLESIAKCVYGLQQTKEPINLY